jgi:hypothetical protein
MAQSAPRRRLKIRPASFNAAPRGSEGKMKIKNFVRRPRLQPAQVSVPLSSFVIRHSIFSRHA